MTKLDNEAPKANNSLLSQLCAILIMGFGLEQSFFAVMNVLLGPFITMHGLHYEKKYLFPLIIVAVSTIITYFAPGVWIYKKGFSLPSIRFLGLVIVWVICVVFVIAKYMKFVT